TLSVSPSSITVAPPFDSTITVTAHGGPVTWSVSVPSAAAGQISVSPASGALSAGQSVTVSVSARNANNFRTVLTFSPDGHHGTRAAQLREHEVEELLAAEAWLDGHQQQHVEFGHQVRVRLDRGAGVDRQPGARPGGADRAQRADRGLRGLGVYGHAAGPGL